MLDEKNNFVKTSINKIEKTDDCLTGRAGLALTARYLASTKICQLLTQFFPFIRKSLKGTCLLSFFHQIIYFFFDGTSPHISYFDGLKKGEGYYLQGGINYINGRYRIL